MTSAVIDYARVSQSLCSCCTRDALVYINRFCDVKSDFTYTRIRHSDYVVRCDESENSFGSTYQLIGLLV